MSISLFSRIYVMKIFLTCTSEDDNEKTDCNRNCIIINNRSFNNRIEAATDKSIITAKRNSLNPGGIDLGRTVVNVESSENLIQTAFNDPAMLRLLLNSDGLAPIIDDIQVMTPSMVDHFVGLN